MKCSRLRENISLCVSCTIIAKIRGDTTSKKGGTTAVGRVMVQGLGTTYSLNTLTYLGKYRMQLIYSKCDCNRLRFGDRRDFTCWKGQKTLLSCRYQTLGRATGSTQTTSSSKVHHFLVGQQSTLSDICSGIPFSASSWIRTFLIVPCRSFISILEDPVMAASADAQAGSCRTPVSLTLPAAVALHLPTF